jgi:hypothetical protein
LLDLLQKKNDFQEVQILLADYYLGDFEYIEEKKNTQQYHKKARDVLVHDEEEY